MRPATSARDSDSVNANNQRRFRLAKIIIILTTMNQIIDVFLRTVNYKK